MKRTRWASSADGGRGAVAAAGLAAEPDVIRTITLSKALGSQGGAVLGTQAIVDHVVNTARTFIFDTGLAPGCVVSSQNPFEARRTRRAFWSTRSNGSPT